MLSAIPAHSTTIIRSLPLGIQSLNVGIQSSMSNRAMVFFNWILLDHSWCNLTIPCLFPRQLTSLALLLPSKVLDQGKRRSILPPQMSKIAVLSVINFHHNLSCCYMMLFYCTKYCTWKDIMPFLEKSDCWQGLNPLTRLVVGVREIIKIWIRKNPVWRRFRGKVCFINFCKKLSLWDMIYHRYVGTTVGRKVGTPRLTHHLTQTISRHT